MGVNIPGGKVTWTASLVAYQADGNGRREYLFDGSTCLPIRASLPIRAGSSTLGEPPPGSSSTWTEIDYVRHLALVAIIRRADQDVKSAWRAMSPGRRRRLRVRHRHRRRMAGSGVAVS